MAVPQCVIAPSPEQDWTDVSNEAHSVELAARNVSGKLYRKHILNYGDLLHPVTGSKIKIDQAFVDKLKTNFANQACDIVQVPLANKSNEHDESPDKNVGEVVGIEDDPKSKKVYALVDARKHADDFGKTLLGASAFMHLDYKDSKTGKRVGPTLLHVAVTNRPYVTGLDPYQEIVAASAEYEGEAALVEMSAGGDESSEPSTPEAHVPRDLKDILAELTADHGIEVPDGLSAEDMATRLSAEPQTIEVPVPDNAAESRLRDQLITALKGTEGETALSGSEITTDDLVAGVAELANRNVALSSTVEEMGGQVEKLVRASVTKEVDDLIAEGRILPAKRDVYLTMALSNREMFDQIIPEEPIVGLSNSAQTTERGVGPRGSEATSRRYDIDAEVARLTAPGGPSGEPNYTQG